MSLFLAGLFVGGILGVVIRGRLARATEDARALDEALRMNSYETAVARQKFRTSPIRGTWWA